MASRTDQDRQDAQHAVRLEIAKQLGRYSRRVREEAYAHIEQEATNHDGGDGYINWSAVGEAAANRALSSYGIIAGPTAAIDAEIVPALEVGAPPPGN